MAVSDYALEITNLHKSFRDFKADAAMALGAPVSKTSRTQPSVLRPDAKDIFARRAGSVFGFIVGSPVSVR